MMAKGKEVIAEKDLVIGREILDEANLGKRLWLIIQEGEIHILPLLSRKGRFTFFLNPSSMLKRPWKSWPDVWARNQPRRMTSI
jgi:hypothetical protein